jgi:hypothetical protein
VARRPRHPNKEIEAAVTHAEDAGWTWIAGKGHAWGLLLCPWNDKDCRCGTFCRFSIWSTPRSPENHARMIVRLVNGCVRLAETTDAQKRRVM